MFATCGKNSYLGQTFEFNLSMNIEFAKIKLSI